MSEQVREDSHSTAIGVLPKDWCCVQLRDIVERKVTYGIVQPGVFAPQGVLLIRGQDYIGGWAEPSAFFRVARPLHELYKRSTTVGGDVLMCIVGATTGAVNLVPSWVTEANITQTTARISCDARRFDRRFAFYVLASELGQLQVRKYIKGSAQPGLNLGDVELFFVPLPLAPEQRKIAKVLTTVDNLIEKTEALIAKYQSVKQGLMQDLFTRGVDEHGHLRPPHAEAPHLYKESELGWIPRGWNIERFGEACEKVSVGIATSTTEHFREQGVPLLRNQNILPSRITTDDLLYISPAFDKINKTKRLRHNDIVTMRTGYPGRSALVPTEMTGWQTFTTLISHPNETKYVPDFMVRQINSELCMSQILALQGGGAQQNLNVGWIVNMRVVRPTLTEQNAICHYIDALDQKIRTEHRLRSKYAAGKTALMQDLLTGKVRVKVDEAANV